jgi:beta-mannanase
VRFSPYPDYHEEQCQTVRKSNTHDAGGGSLWWARLSSAGFSTRF